MRRRWPIWVLTRSTVAFAVSSPSEFDCIHLITENVRNAEICSIARARLADIDRAWEAVQDAEVSVIHPFISTSPLHRQVKLRQDAWRVREMARIAVAHAYGYAENVDLPSRIRRIQKTISSWRCVRLC